TARQLVIANRGSAKIHDLEPLEGLARAAVVPSAADARRREARETPEPPAPRVFRRPSDVREAELIEALRRNRFRPQQTADDLGIRRASLYDLIDKCPSLRTASEIGAAEIEAALDAHNRSSERAADALEVSEQALRRRCGRLGIEI
ncbi:MAG: sigma-54-dependent Fis family transcriptional regulator, partial [Acidobacteriota bacterium]